MTRRVVTTRRADEDIDLAVEYYLLAGEHAVAEAIVDALAAALKLLVGHPSIGSARWEALIGIPDLRTLPLRHHPYVLIYTDDPDAARIHRFLHTSRDIPAELAATAASRISPPARIGALKYPPVTEIESTTDILDDLRRDRL
ncbi:type II toxin-antitoxin system RelE/ParE family toxin [Microbacterium sp. A8/3-1]|uniref:Type II toxin-antitoxin system RelE/ParE family toxin n=1 Tax=Microbacterium sp. A8/3-1 TaxID=3160749 RepID=A0AAU7VT27_9MICO